MQPASKRRLLVAVVLPLAVAALLPVLLRPSTTSPQVVVYCAHDSIFADAVLQAFEQRSGIRVTVRYDEEASKSLGLTQLLLAEKATPRCDVFWNNQTLGTIRLQRAGVLQACPPDWFRRIPEHYRDPAGCWCGFAGRFRVWLVNTSRMQASVRTVDQAFAADDLSRCSIAVPLFGTTLTLSTGRVLPVRFVGEQHVLEDLGRIPTVQDWLMKIQPEPWMLGRSQDRVG